MPELAIFPKPRVFEASGSRRPCYAVVHRAVAELRRALPQELGMGLEVVQLPGITLRVNAGACGVSAAEAQGYTLRITEDRIEAESWTRAGIRSAIETLHQLLRESPDDVAICTIHDRPAFATRGVMLDVSRCRIPTMQEFGRIIEQLASLKCNHLQLYTEHTYAYSFAESVWQGWSPITPDELNRIDAMCRARGIELAANQNCFGHLRQWLENPEFASLAETHGDWMFDVWPRSGPFSLCPTDPASIAFVRKMLAELTPCVRSPLINIGCDETYDIAFGRSKSECDAKGRGRVFAAFVAEIAAAAAAVGKRSMFWGDVALSHPECLADLPKDMIALAWGYEPTSAFDAWGAALAQAGLEFWVCPGTSSWRSITGRTTERNGNIAAAVSAGLAFGATGVLVCDWGDTGHWQQWPIALQGMAMGLGAAWTGQAIDEGELPALSKLLYGELSRDLAGHIEAMGDVDRDLRATCGALSHPSRTVLPNQSAMFIDLFKDHDELAEIGDPAVWAEARRKLDTASAGVDANVHHVSPLVREELRHTIALAEFALQRGHARRYPLGSESPSADEWRTLKAEHQRLWRLRSREGGLEQSCTFFDEVERKLARGVTA